MKRLIFTLCCCILVCAMAAPALAVDNYRFASENTEEFYNAGITTVTFDGEIPGYVQEVYDFAPHTIYNSEYGATIITPENGASYGFFSEKPVNAPSSSSPNPSVSPTEWVREEEDERRSGQGFAVPSGAALSEVREDAPQYALTPVEDVRKSDSSIGTLKIPAIGLTVTAYDGEVTAAMKKGVGHIDSTSCWLGTIGIVGHNRSGVFGKLKALQTGDEITYSTLLGTKTYVVNFIGKIAANDWSYLQYTADNRMTLLTCVENQPELRLCVTAVEK